MKILLALVLLAVLVLPVVVGATTVALATAPRTFATPFAWVPEGGFADAFPYGQCTWWAAYNRRVTWGGNARDWLENAKAQGLATSDEPSIGAIAVYRPGGEYSGYGHVAIVTATSARSYVVSEMNAPTWGVVSIRVVDWPDPHVQGFIPVTSEERR